MHELEQRLIEAEKLLDPFYYRVYESIGIGEKSNKWEDRNRLWQKLGIGKPDCADWQRSELKRLQICLDKLQFANNLSRSKCFKLCSSVKEVDHNSLHFGMLHGMKNISEEKKILQKLKKVEKDSSAQIQIQCRELDYKSNITLKQQTNEEEEIQSCAVYGNKWRSLGTKEDILKNIKALCEEVGNEDDPILLKKNLAAVENDLRSLDKQFSAFRYLSIEASIYISQLRKQNQQNKAKETHLLNNTASFVNSMKEKPASLNNIRKAFRKLQYQA